MTNNVWTETGTTWNTQPATGQTIASWPMAANELNRVEISSVALDAAAGDGLLSLGLIISDPASDTVYSFNSRAAPAGLQPQLVLEKASAAVSFSDWIAGFADLSAPAPADDPDGDRLNNAGEFLFNRDPARAENSPVLTIASALGGVMLGFPQRKRLPPEMFYVIESTASLRPAAWRPAAGVEFSRAGDLGGAFLMNAFIPAGTGRQSFYRFRIVAGP